MVGKSASPFCLYDFELVSGGEWGILVVQGVAIPIGDGGNIVLKRQVAAVTAPAESLNCYLYAFLEIYGVGNVEAIHIKILL